MDIVLTTGFLITGGEIQEGLKSIPSFIRPYKSAPPDFASETQTRGSRVHVICNYADCKWVQYT